MGTRAHSSIKIAYFYLFSAAVLLVHFVGNSAYAYHIPEGVDQTMIADIEMRAAPSASQKANRTQLEAATPQLRERKESSESD
jgi:hypothetical protein